ncbi:MAG: SDR family oxidoreductase [Planctomycetes bacterium]|nr:SDR family oxidoreductase [Planctomycetota bacterium]
MELRDRVALVTGASKGLGAAIALELAAQGANCALLARSTELVDRLANVVRGMGRHALAVTCDVSKTKDVREAVRRIESEFGRVDILVNNAGIEQNGPIEGVTDEAWSRLLGTNVTGVFLMLREALPLLRRSAHASVINVASAAGLVGIPLTAAYGATKAAVIQMTRALALEWRPHGIRVNCVCPAFIETDMARRGLEYFQDLGFPVDLLLSYRQGRLGTPAEVAKAVAYLASADSSFVTGHALAVDGGATVS